MPAIKTSFIIITWNGLHFVRKLLESMGNILYRDDVEVILVDNGSEDGTPSFIRQAYPRVVLLELSSNKGVAYARNRGLEVAHGEYLCIVDNDVIMKEEVFDAMLAYMDAHPEVGLCSCRLNYADGTIQESCKIYPGFFHKVANLLKINRNYSYAHQMYGEPFEPVYVIGAFQWIRRQAYEQVGLLDEKIFYGPEDCDYCLRIRKAGWHIMYLPQYQLIHYCQRMTNHHPFSLMGLRHIWGLMYLYCKYRRI